MEGDKKMREIRNKLYCNRLSSQEGLCAMK